MPHLQLPKSSAQKKSVLVVVQPIMTVRELSKEDSFHLGLVEAWIFCWQDNLFILGIRIDGPMEFDGSVTFVL